MPLPRPSHLLALVLSVGIIAGATGCTDGPGSARAEGRRTASGSGNPAASAGAATPAAAEPLPALPAPRRTYPVGSETLRLQRGAARPLKVTVWYPASSPGSARPARGRFPLVLFSHGLGGLPADYRPLLVRWAAAGFVVAAPAYPHTSRGTDGNVLDVFNQPADATYVLTDLLARDTRADDRLRGHLYANRVAAAGHSAGAITTLGLFALARDPRVRAGVVLAGTTFGAGTAFQGNPAPILFVHGGRDQTVPYSAGKAAYDAVPWPKALLSLPEEGHATAVSTGGGAAFTLIAEESLDFLRWSLYGDAAARRRLHQRAAHSSVGTLDDRLGSD